ncbi:MAG TPA: TAXI family TRAP transporter solute-binding subunit [Beijerinckiaceae bacterium]
MIRRLSRLFTQRKWMPVLGVLILGLVAASAGLGYWYFAGPTTFSVAVGPKDDPETRLVEAYAQALVEQKKDVRLRLVPVSGAREAGEALRAKRVEFAVVRPDVMLPDNGLTVAILREEAAIIIAPEAAKIDDVADLAKKRLGVVTHHEADSAFVETILNHYGLAPSDLTLVPMSADEAGAAVQAKRVDAVVIVAAPVSRAAGAVVRSISKAVGDKIAIVPITEAEAMSLRSPALSAVTIPPGSFEGRPRQPGEEVKTLGVSYRLMARSEIDRGPVSKAAQYLFQMRSRIAAAAPSVNQMRAPDTDTSTSAALPNHPGAVDYFNREQLTFMDRYGDWIWMILFFGGGVSSAAAWVFQLFARKRRELVDEVLDRLLCILSEARGAKSVAALDELAAEIDGLVIHAVRYARHRTTGTRTLSALIMAIDSARAAIADQRRTMLAESAPPIESASTAAAMPRSARRA